MFRVLPLGNSLTPNLATSYGIEDVRGYDAMTPRGWRLAREAIGHFRLDMMTVNGIAAHGQGLDFWNIKYVIAAPDPRLTVGAVDRTLGLDLEEVYSGPDGRLWQNRRVLPRVRLTGPGEAGLERRTPIAWHIEVTAPSAVTLVVANPYFPGWRAQLDERPVAIWAHAGDAITIAVPGGHHVVDFTYQPWTFRVGLAIGLVSLTFLLVVVLRPVLARCRSRRHRARGRRGTDESGASRLSC